MSSRKRMYNRWKILTERTQIMKKCQKVHQIFTGINLSIKKLTDSLFIQPKNNQLAPTSKSSSASKIFSVIENNFKQTFASWRLKNTQ